MKKISSIALAVLFCFLSFWAINLKADAAVISIQTISDGQTWRQSWSSGVEYASLNVDVNETALYTFTVTDYKQTGYFNIEIIDLTTEDYIGQVNDTLPRPFFLHKDHLYQLDCSYVDSYYYEYTAADLAITVNKNTEEIHTLPTCQLSSSNLLAQFSSDDDTLFLQYTPTQSGDFSLYFSELHAYISLYNASTGALVEEYVDSEYLYDGTWYSRDQLVFNLKAGTKYYFFIDSYDSSTTRLSMLKNTKDVKTIVATAPIGTFESYYDFSISKFDFSYKITYTDYSTRTFSRSWYLEEIGYNAPEIEYGGEYVFIDEYEYLAPGTYPVYSIYNGVSTTLYVKILSITDTLSQKLNPVAENQTMRITYEGEDYYTYWWRIKVSSSGSYAIYRYDSDDFSTNFSNYSIALVDKNNREVPFDRVRYTYSLTANEEYALRFEYQYNPSYSYNTIDFRLQKEYTLNGWVNENGRWAYFENGQRLANCWRKDSSGWCYLGADGYMMTSAWVPDSLGLCWVDESGYIVYSRWIHDGIGWRYVDANGYVLKNAWQKDSIGWCYVGADGYMYADTWHYDSVGLCYIGANGYCITNQWKQHPNGWIYFNANGNPVKNTWKLKGSDWLYLGTDGIALRNQWKNDSKGWCYLGSDCIMMTNAWVPDSRGLCWVDESGYIVYSRWIHDGIGWRYVDANGYVLKNAWQKDSIGWCYVGADGYMYADTWHYDSVGLCYIGANGYCITNQWKQHPNGWIYFNENGNPVRNAYVDGYYIGADGFRVE